MNTAEETTSLLEIDWIRKKARTGQYQISEHVIRFLMAGLLTLPEMLAAIDSARIVEVRKPARPMKNVLVQGRVGEKTIILQCAADADATRLIVSLAYLTAAPEWRELNCMKDHDADQTNAFIPQCFFCGGEVKSITVGNFDYRLEGQLFVIKDTPAGLCLRCGEKYVTAATAKRINALIESGRFTGAEQVRVMQYDQAPMKGLYADGT